MHSLQVEIDFKPGLLAQFPDWMDCVRSSVYSCGHPFKVIAADLDMSVSELSRKLSKNPSDPVHFPVDRLPDLIAATGDKRPVYWLIEKFLEDADSKRKRAVDDLTQLLPQIQAALKACK